MCTECELVIAGGLTGLPFVLAWFRYWWRRWRLKETTWPTRRSRTSACTSSSRPTSVH
jgi:hypothetical protein